MIGGIVLSMECGAMGAEADLCDLSLPVPRTRHGFSVVGGEAVCCSQPARSCSAAIVDTPLSAEHSH